MTSDARGREAYVSTILSPSKNIEKCLPSKEIWQQLGMPYKKYMFSDSRRKRRQINYNEIRESLENLLASLFTYSTWSRSKH